MAVPGLSVQDWRSRDYLRSNCGLAFSCTLARTCKLDNRRVLQPGRHPIPQKSEGRKALTGKQATSIAARVSAAFYLREFELTRACRERIHCTQIVPIIRQCRLFCPSRHYK